MRREPRYHFLSIFLFIQWGSPGPRDSHKEVPPGGAVAKGHLEKK